MGPGPLPMLTLGSTTLQLIFRVATQGPTHVSRTSTGPTNQHARTRARAHTHTHTRRRRRQQQQQQQTFGFDARYSRVQHGGEVLQVGPDEQCAVVVRRLGTNPGRRIQSAHGEHTVSTWPEHDQHTVST